MGTAARPASAAYDAEPTSKRNLDEFNFRYRPVRPNLARVVDHQKHELERVRDSLFLDIVVIPNERMRRQSGKAAMSGRRCARSIFVAAIVLLAFAGTGSGGTASGPCEGSGARAVNVGDDANTLAGVSVRSRCDAWAVGLFSNGRAWQTLVEHWDGTRWRHVTSPNPGGPSRNDQLTGVAAVSDRNVWAVGSFSNGRARQTLIEHWNGSGWKVSKSLNPGGSRRTDRLAAVDASSRSNVWAVGFFEARTRLALRTLVLRWNGSAWRRVRSPNPGHMRENVLSGVSVVSPTDVWAVGYHTTATERQALILHWDGSDWSRFTIPNPPDSLGGPTLTAVSASSASNAWAVGFYYDGTAQRPLALHWDGTEWSPENGPTADESVVPHGVVTTSNTSAWSVGYTGCCIYSSMMARWDSPGWQVVPSPNPGAPDGDTVLNGVDAEPSGYGWAIGYYFDGTTARALVTECC